MENGCGGYHVVREQVFEIGILVSGGTRGRSILERKRSVSFQSGWDGAQKHDAAPIGVEQEDAELTENRCRLFLSRPRSRLCMSFRLMPFAFIHLVSLGPTAAKAMVGLRP